MHVLTPREARLAAAGGFALPVVMLLLLAALWQVMEVRERQAEALSAKLNPPPPALDAPSYARGMEIYQMACIACHGQNGQGVPRLGKELVNSTFAKQITDKQLAEFFINVRPIDDLRNTTGVAMPARGGRADFSDQNIADVVTYLRGLQNPKRIPAGPLPDVEVALADPPAASEAPTSAPVKPSVATAAPTAAVAANAVVKAPATISNTSAAPVAVAMAVGNSPDHPDSLAVALDPDSIKRGKRTFLSCMACHGRDATGVKGMGKDLVHSQFVGGLSDDELVAFIKKGRGPTDPGNTTHVAMPPKGGNPTLTDAQLKDVVVYVRSLRQQAKVQ
jgi:disulfide bond formation protein DsbB